MMAVAGICLIYSITDFPERCNRNIAFNENVNNSSARDVMRIIHPGQPVDESKFKLKCEVLSQRFDVK